LLHVAASQCNPVFGIERTRHQAGFFVFAPAASFYRLKAGKRMI
jgi:hypothetical protein